MLRGGPAYLVTHRFVAGNGQPGWANGARVRVFEQLGRGQAHLVTDGTVAGDGQAGLGGTLRVAVGDQFGRGQAHLVTHRFVAGDGQAGWAGGAWVYVGELLAATAELRRRPPGPRRWPEGFSGSVRIVFGQLLGRVNAVLITFVHGWAGFLC